LPEYCTVSAHCGENRLAAGHSGTEHLEPSPCSVGSALGRFLCGRYHLVCDHCRQDFVTVEFSCERA